MRSVPRIASVAAAITLVLIASGCGKKSASPLGLSNQPPTVTLTSMNAGGSTHALRWTGADGDGRVDHYLVSSDPRALARLDATSGWTRADGGGRVLALGRAGAAVDEDAAHPVEPTFFSVRAVDDDGAVSDPATRTFFADNVAPEVKIVHPVPSMFSPIYVPGTVRIRWEGHDPDGVVPSRLAKYKYKLLDSGSAFPVDLAITNPDSLRRFYAPAFAGWDSVPGESLGVTLRDLHPDLSYLFVLVGFDDEGAYSPVFSRQSNMLYLRAGYTGFSGPRFSVSGGGLDHRFLFSGVTDPPQSVTIKVPARDPVTVRWSAQPSQGSYLIAYRWAIDIADPSDETPRRFPLDVRYWSRWSLTTTSVIVSPLLPLPPKLTRRLYLEALDSFGLKSRVMVQVEFVTVRRDRPTLVVLDTRLPHETGLGSAPAPVRPIGNWPNYAELDSFLVARGGVQWQGYPTGFVSSPGLFSGYDYDVFRTKTTALDKTVPLDLLMRYRNVVWITDSNVGMSDAALRPFGGAYALKYMSAPGRQNTLVPFAQAGGRVWFVGGGAAYAMSTDLYNRVNNDVSTFVYSSALGELVPGRPMWDLAHWRSEFSNWTNTNRWVTRIAPAAGHPGVPSYSGLPPTLTLRSAGTDPVPPQRTPTLFYGGIRTTFEYLTLPNIVTERFSPWPNAPAVSVLDSLYAVRGVYPGGVDLPCMTVYRGRECGQVVFSGFDLWSWARPQSRAIVDVVLRDLWHMTPTTEAAGVATLDDIGDGGEDEGLIRR